MNIYTKGNVDEIRNIPVLTDGQIYIYALLNSPQANIKIGKSSNIAQRIASLSGSNGGGSKLLRIYVSPCSTWMHSMEGTCHTHFDFCRIPGTEWFDGTKV